MNKIKMLYGFSVAIPLVALGVGCQMSSRLNNDVVIARVEGSPIGRLKAFHGQMGMFTRALAFIMSHGVNSPLGNYMRLVDTIKEHYMMNALQSLYLAADVVSTPENVAPATTR